MATLLRLGSYGFNLDLLTTWTQQTRNGTLEVHLYFAVAVNDEPEKLVFQGEDAARVSAYLRAHSTDLTKWMPA